MPIAELLVPGRDGRTDPLHQFEPLGQRGAGLGDHHDNSIACAVWRSQDRDAKVEIVNKEFIGGAAPAAPAKK